MDCVPASDEEDISFPAPVAAPKSNPLEDPYSFEALVAAASCRDPIQTVNKWITTRSPSGPHSTYQDVESISEFTKEQAATHQITVPPSSITKFSTTPPAELMRKAHKRLISTSSLTSLGPAPSERHNEAQGEYQPSALPVIDISDASDYDGGPKTNRELPKPGKKTRRPAKSSEPKSKGPRNSKYKAEAEVVDTVRTGTEVEFLCESKPPPRKRKTPVEVAHNEPHKKKARKSSMENLPDRDLALPSLTDSTIPAPRVLLNDAPPSFLNASNSHLGQNSREPSEDTVKPPKKSKKVLARSEGGSTPEAASTITLKLTESGKKKGKSEKVPVVALEDDIADVNARLVVPHKYEGPLPSSYKLKPFIELARRRRKKNAVQSDQESEDELLIQPTNTSGKAKAISQSPASENNKEGKRKAPKSGETSLAEASKQLGTSIDCTRDVDATTLVPHDSALAKSNPLRDTNKLSDEPPSSNSPAVAAEPPNPTRLSIEHTIPKRRDSMTSLLQRAGLHAPLSSSRLTVPATARIAPLHLNRKTPPPPPLPIPKPKKKVESEEETDEEEYVGLNEKQIARLKEEKRKKAWYSP